MIKAILFDMDGVLVDSEEFICIAAINYLKKQGINPVKEDFIPFVGMGEERYIGGVAKKYGLTLDLEKAKVETYKEYGKIAAGTLPAMNQVIPFIKSCHEKRLKLAVATSADKMKMEINLMESGIGADSFDALICGEMITNKKPDPEIYIKAAKAIGIAPVDCIVIEDALTGIQAAKSAGCRAVGITSWFSKSELLAAGADQVVDCIDEVEIH